MDTSLPLEAEKISAVQPVLKLSTSDINDTGSLGAGGGDYVSTSTEGNGNRQELAERANNYWRNHMEQNNTVVASAFQGMYKSTVILLLL